MRLSPLKATSQKELLFINLYKAILLKLLKAVSVEEDESNCFPLQHYHVFLKVFTD